MKTKVAVTEDGRLVELYVERERTSGWSAISIRGIVKNILPGMQAALWTSA